MPDSSPRYARTFFHGALNLDQQKTRAKELLRGFRRGDADAAARVAAHHPEPPSPDAAKLADAQLVLARENGFASWPKLKAHCDAVALRQSRIEAGKPTVLDTPGTLHVRCGEDIQHSLKVAGFQGPFFEFADPFCQGPVPDLPPEQFRKARTRFVAQAYGIEENDARARFDREYARLPEMREAEHTVLWFEHDSYDQLILAFLLSQLDGADLSRVSMICVDTVPGVPHFTGLGQLAPSTLQLLWESERRPVTAAQVELGIRVWDAVRAPDPRGLHAIAQGGTPALPLMARSLQRHLQELPEARSGLSLTQELTLSILAQDGPMTAGMIFRDLMRDREPLPFLGDLMFWHVLVDMRRTREPLFDIDPATAAEPWPHRRVAISRKGREVLEGRVDFLDLYTSERWVGGVRIAGGEPAPRRNRETGAIEP